MNKYKRLKIKKQAINLWLTFFFPITIIGFISIPFILKELVFNIDILFEAILILFLISSIMSTLLTLVNSNILKSG